MKKPGIFYGYWIVAVAFLCLFTYSGVGYYAPSLFYQPLEMEFGWGRGAVSAAFTVIFVVQGVAAPYIGRLVDVHGAKRLIVLGAFITGIGFFALYFIQNLWSFYACYGVISVGMTAFSAIPATKLVALWFKKRRGLALGIASSSVGVAAFILAPIIATYLIPGYGWRLTYVFLGLLTWILIIPAALLIVKTRPEDIGLLPDGVRQPEANDSSLKPPATEEWSLTAALKTMTFWFITAGFFAANLCHTTIIQHQVNLLTDMGYPVASASFALGAVGLGSTTGKLIFGPACDRFPAKYMAIVAFSLQVIGLFVLINLKASSPAGMVWFYVIPFSLGVGGWLPNMSMIISNSFGLAAYGAIFGVLNLAVNFGTAFGPLVAGLMYDAMQTYSGVFILLLVMYAIAITAMISVRRPRVSAPLNK